MRRRRRRAESWSACCTNTRYPRIFRLAGWGLVRVHLTWSRMHVSLPSRIDGAANCVGACPSRRAGGMGGQKWEDIVRRQCDSTPRSAPSNVVSSPSLLNRLDRSEARTRYERSRVRADTEDKFVLLVFAPAGV